MKTKKPVRIVQYLGPWHDAWAVNNVDRRKPVLIGIYSSKTEAMVECAKAGLEYRLEAAA